MNINYTIANLFLLYFLFYLKTTINQRIKILIDSLENGRQNRFAEKTGLAGSTLNAYLGERQSAPSVEVLEKIVTVYPEINCRWLIVGDGDMLTGGTENTQQETADLIQDLQKQIFTQAKLNLKLNADNKKLLAENKELKKKSA